MAREPCDRGAARKTPGIASKMMRRARRSGSRRAGAMNPAAVPATSPARDVGVDASALLGREEVAGHESDRGPAVAVTAPSARRREQQRAVVREARSRGSGAPVSRMLAESRGTAVEPGRRGMPTGITNTAPTSSVAVLSNASWASLMLPRRRRSGELRRDRGRSSRRPPWRGRARSRQRDHPRRARPADPLDDLPARERGGGAERLRGRPGRLAGGGGALACFRVLAPSSMFPASCRAAEIASCGGAASKASCGERGCPWLAVGARGEAQMQVGATASRTVARLRARPRPTGPRRTAPGRRSAFRSRRLGHHFAEPAVLLRLRIMSLTRPVIVRPPRWRSARCRRREERAAGDDALERCGEHRAGLLMLAAGKKSRIRLIDSGASRVCSVESTRWPSPPRRARCARSLSSRISPIRDHVRVLAQHAAQRAFEGCGVGADLTLLDDRALVA